MAQREKKSDMGTTKMMPPAKENMVTHQHSKKKGMPLPLSRNIRSRLLRCQVSTSLMSPHGLMPPRTAPTLFTVALLGHRDHDASWGVDDSSRGCAGLDSVACPQKTSRWGACDVQEDDLSRGGDMSRKYALLASTTSELRLDPGGWPSDYRVGHP